MLKSLSAMLLPAIALTAIPATAQRAPEPRQVSIPFITYGGARDFQAAPGGRGVYIQNSRRNWFYASFFSRCNDLPFATRIGFRTFGGGSSLERGDTILVGRERCRIDSIVRSGPPPKKVKKARR